jgi:hypothetical protein
MEERISFVTHEGKKIMLVDFSDCESKQILILLEAVKQTVSRHAPGSLLTLGDFSGAHLDRAVVSRLKEVMVLDRPYVKRAALVGVDAIPKVYLENMKSFSQRNIPTFKTREAAMDWLVKEE